MEYKLSLQQIKGIYNSGRIVERVTKVESNVSHSGREFRKEMATGALENLPNPSAIEKYANNLEEIGLGEEARKLRERYKRIQITAQEKLEEE